MHSALMVFSVSVLVTILFWTALPASFQTNENSDYVDFYEPVARNILKGAGISRGGAPATQYPPGYPLLLAGLFRVADLLGIMEEEALSAFTLTAAGVATVFLSMLARTIWTPRLALLSSLIWITYPPFLWLTKQPNSEIPFLGFFYAGLFAFWQMMQQKRTVMAAFLPGALMGLSMLIRPIAIGVVFAICVAFCLLAKDIRPKSRLLLLAMMLAGTLMTILPWEAWVYLKTGRIIPLSSGSIASVQDGLTFALSPKTYQRTIDVDQDVAELMVVFHAKSERKPISSFKDMVSIQIELLLTQPAVMAKLYALKTVRSWFGTNTGRFETPLLLFQAAYLSLALAGSVAMWRLNGSARRAAILVWLMVLYFWGMTIIALSILRYMVPAMGLLMILVPGSVSKIEKAKLLVAK
jgi:4-amino-4-deoxy-L-arabinose transferase-like glycosyltransferase